MKGHALQYSQQSFVVAQTGTHPTSIASRVDSMGYSQGVLCNKVNEHAGAHKYNLRERSQSQKRTDSPTSKLADFLKDFRPTPHDLKCNLLLPFS